MKRRLVTINASISSMFKVSFFSAALLIANKPWTAIFTTSLKARAEKVLQNLWSVSYSLLALVELRKSEYTSEEEAECGGENNLD